MDNYCKTCLHDGVDIGFCDKCYYNHILEEKGIPPTKYEAKPKPLTNADRIRAMSVEEMAEFMNCGACPPGKDVSELCHDEDGGSVPDMCNLCWFNWLKQEADT